MEGACNGIFCGHVDCPAVRAALSSRLTREPVPVMLRPVQYIQETQASLPKETYGNYKRPREATNAHFRGKIRRGNLDQAGPGEAGCRGRGAVGRGSRCSWHGLLALVREHLTGLPGSVVLTSSEDVTKTIRCQL